MSKKNNLDYLNRPVRRRAPFYCSLPALLASLVRAPFLWLGRFFGIVDDR